LRLRVQRSSAKQQHSVTRRAARTRHVRLAPYWRHHPFATGAAVSAASLAVNMVLCGSLASLRPVVNSTRPRTAGAGDQAEKMAKQAAVSPAAVRVMELSEEVRSSQEEGSNQACSSHTFGVETGSHVHMARALAPIRLPCTNAPWAIFNPSLPELRLGSCSHQAAISCFPMASVSPGTLSPAYTVHTASRTSAIRGPEVCSARL